MRANLAARTVVTLVSSSSAAADERRSQDEIPSSDVIAMNESGSGDVVAVGEERDVLQRAASMPTEAETSMGDDGSETVVSELGDDSEAHGKMLPGVWVKGLMSPLAGGAGVKVPAQRGR